MDSLASLQGPSQAAAWGRTKVRPSRQGLPSQSWFSLLSSLCPTRVVLAGPVTCQAGLLIAILRHNDARLGFDPCTLVGFSVELPPGPREMEWTKKEVKWWQAAHLCLHTIDAALKGYTAWREASMKSSAGLVVGSQTRLTISAFKAASRALKREGSLTGSGNDASPFDPDPLAPVQGQRTEGETFAANRLPEVTQFIQIVGNYGKDPALPHRPKDEEIEQADSDQEDVGGATSKDTSQAVLARRNARFFAKYSAKVQHSSEATGMGLFATKDWPAGTQVPVKGPWFETLLEVQQFLAPLEPNAQNMFGCRVVRVSVCSSDAENTSGGLPKSIFKVMTNPVGFVNHFTGLSNQPNCILIWVVGVGLGDHTLALKTTKVVKAGTQLLLNYGPLHPCSLRVRKQGSPRKAALTTHKSGKKNPSRTARVDNMA